MAIIPMKCTKCGASLEVNDSLERGYCNYCGQTFLVADVLQRKQVIDESHKLGPLLDLAETALKSREYVKCGEHCDSAILIDGKNARAWYLKGCAAEGLKRGSGAPFFEKSREYGGDYKYVRQAEVRRFRITIDKAGTLMQPKVNIYVDKELVAQVKCGDMEDVTITEGKHLVSLKQNMAVKTAWKQNIIVGDDNVHLKLVWLKTEKRYDISITF